MPAFFVRLYVELEMRQAAHGRFLETPEREFRLLPVDAPVGLEEGIA